MTFSSLLDPANVRLDVTIESKEDLLLMLSQEAAKATGLSAAGILDALTSREALGSTGIGSGVALPHAAILGLERPFASLVRLAAPLLYGAVDHAPVSVVLLLLFPLGQQQYALTILANAARCLRSPETRKRLSDADNSFDVPQLLNEHAS